MSSAHAPAMRDTVHPVFVGFWENPNPGSDGTTTSNDRRCPLERDRVGQRADQLQELDDRPGHPCVSTSGIAPGLSDLTWMKWMSSPSISVRN